jgi:hypothetical protein
MFELSKRWNFILLLVLGSTYTIACVTTVCQTTFILRFSSAELSANLDARPEHRHVASLRRDLRRGRGDQNPILRSWVSTLVKSSLPMGRVLKAKNIFIYFEKHSRLLRNWLSIGRFFAHLVTWSPPLWVRIYIRGLEGIFAFRTIKTAEKASFSTIWYGYTNPWSK